MPMKISNYILIIVISIVLINCKKKENVGFTIKGQIQGNFKEYIYLKFHNKIDSSLVKNNEFSFTGENENPIEAKFYPSSPKSKKMMGLAPFMLENSKIYISLNYDQSDFRGELTEYLKLKSISGSKSQQLMTSFNVKMKNTFYNENEESIRKTILYNNLLEFIKVNPKSILSGKNLASLNNFYGYLNSNQMENLYKLVDTNYQAKKDLTTIKSIIKRRKLLDIGKTSPRIILPNQNKKLIDNESIKAKYLLLDFWASWCVPCRQTNPELRKIYNEFKNKKFEILGISIDRDIEKWKTAIIKDDLNWIQVVDSLNSSTKKFLLRGVPYNILLDSSGKIIKINLKPKELSKFLFEQLKN
jgi:thiol-disulfide isomerase/thioredoxin